jgi:hypothetical protein
MQLLNSYLIATFRRLIAGEVVGQSSRRIAAYFSPANSRRLSNRKLAISGDPSLVSGQLVDTPSLIGKSPNGRHYTTANSGY